MNTNLMHLRQAAKLSYKAGPLHGKTIGEIASLEGFSKRRVQQLIELAFLAPDVIRSVREGRQPTGLTSDWLLRHAYSPIWSEQRDLFSTL